MNFQIKTTAVWVSLLIAQCSQILAQMQTQSQYGKQATSAWDTTSMSLATLFPRYNLPQIDRILFCWQPLQSWNSTDLEHQLETRNWHMSRIATESPIWSALTSRLPPTTDTSYAQAKRVSSKSTITSWGARSLQAHRLSLAISNVRKDSSSKKIWEMYTRLESSMESINGHFMATLHNQMTSLSILKN